MLKSKKTKRELDRRVIETYTPGSSNYLKFLDPMQFGSEFGASDNTKNTIIGCFYGEDDSSFATDWDVTEFGDSRTLYLSAKRLAAVYDLPTDVLNGEGISVHVAAYERIASTDIPGYAAAQGLDPPDMQFLQAPDGPKEITTKKGANDSTETLANLQMVQAVAPKAKLALWIGENSDMGEIYMMNYIASNYGNDFDAKPPAADVLLYTW
eukprot:gene7550-7760_t